MEFAISDTAHYGAMTRGPRIVDAYTRDTLRQILHEIQTGAFAREWILENLAGRPVFHALEQASAQHPIEQVGEVVRARMAFQPKRDV